MSISMGYGYEERGEERENVLDDEWVPCLDACDERVCEGVVHPYSIIQHEKTKRKKKEKRENIRELVSVSRA